MFFFTSFSISKTLLSFFFKYKNLEPYHPAEFCHDNPVFESELVDKEGASRVFDSETKIVITSINKNPDNKNLPQQINSDTSDLEPNETKLNTSETLSLTNEATLVLQKSQKKGNRFLLLR